MKGPKGSDCDAMILIECSITKIIFLHILMHEYFVLDCTHTKGRTHGDHGIVSSFNLVMCFHGTYGTYINGTYYGAYQFSMWVSDHDI